MPSLAIAGGASASLGRSIVTAMLASKSVTPWNAVLLSRTSKIPLWLQAIDPDSSRVTVTAVDYTSPDSLTSALRGVETLISVASAVDGTRAQMEINLLNAAIAAGCKRFAPSAWGCGPRSYERGLMQYLNDGIWDACLTNKGKIESARFNNGMFMNYIGHGIFTSEAQVDDETKLRAFKAGGGYGDATDLAIEGLHPDGDLADNSGAFLIGLSNAVAEIPVTDDGKWPIVMATSMRDVGRFVVASLDLPKWEDDMNMVGDCISMGELVEIAEKVTGKKFDVKKLTSGDIKKAAESLKPDQFLEQVWVELKLNYCADEEGLTRFEPVVNRLCPEVKPISFRDYMRTHWRSYQAEQQKLEDRIGQ